MPRWHTMDGVHPVATLLFMYAADLCDSYDTPES